jgi:hypothetical protein
MNRKRLQTIVFLGFIVVLFLDAAWLMCAWGPNAFVGSAGKN